MHHLGLEFSPTWAWSGETDHFFTPVRLWLDTSPLALVARLWQNIGTIEFEHWDVGKKGKKTLLGEILVVSYFLFLILGGIQLIIWLSRHLSFSFCFSLMRFIQALKFKLLESWHARCMTSNTFELHCVSYPIVMEGSFWISLVCVWERTERS